MMKLQEPNHGLPSPDFQSTDVCHIIGRGIEMEKSDRFMVTGTRGGMVVKYTVNKYEDGKPFAVVSESGRIKLRRVGGYPPVIDSFRLDVGDVKIAIDVEREFVKIEDGTTQISLTAMFGGMIMDGKKWYTPEEYAEIVAQGRVAEATKMRRPDPVSKEVIEEACDVIGDVLTLYYESFWPGVVKEVKNQLRPSG